MGVKGEGQVLYCLHCFILAFVIVPGLKFGIFGTIQWDTRNLKSGIHHENLYPIFGLSLK